jgi:hypothetical protein
LLLVTVGNGSSAGAKTVTGVTYNGASLTKIWDQLSGTNNERHTGWYKVAPDTGAHDIVVTYSAVEDEMIVGGMSFNGVDQSTPVGTANSNTGTTATSTVNVTSAAGDLVVDGTYTGRSTITVGAGQTSRWEEENVGGNFSGGGSEEAGAASVTMSWALGAGGFADRWVCGGVPLKPAATATEPAPPPHILMPREVVYPVSMYTWTQSPMKQQVLPKPQLMGQMVM